MFEKKDEKKVDAKPEQKDEKKGKVKHVQSKHEGETHHNLLPEDPHQVVVKPMEDKELNPGEIGVRTIEPSVKTEIED